MKRFHVPVRLILAVLALVVPLTTIAWSAETTRPNILLIMADDMGFECLGANGGVDYQTPHLDALASEGMRLTRCHAQPLCTPSRVQLMTGLYNSRNYVRFGQLDPQLKTFGHYFKARGYDTVIAGKWQLDGGAEAPRKSGFDRWCLWQITARPSRHWGPGLEIDGETRTFPDDQFGPDIVVDYLKTFMAEHAENSDRPFFAYYPMILPHDPFVSTPLNAKSTRRKNQGDPKLFPDFIHYTDALVGRLIDHLDQLGLRDNTLVLFVGDNGTSRKITSQLDGERYPGGKGQLTRNGTHVPCVVSWPARIKAGSVSDALIDFSDIFPTLAEAAGLELPSDYLTDGLSFLPVLLGKSPGVRDWSYCFYERGGQRDKARQFVHNHRFKLYDNGKFYDLQKDLWETQPVPNPSGPVFDMLRHALNEQMKIARAADDPIRQRQIELPETTYNRMPNFETKTGR